MRTGRKLQNRERVEKCKETLDQLSRFMGDILDGKLSQREAAEALGLTAQGLSHELNSCFKKYLKYSHVFSDEDIKTCWEMWKLLLKSWQRMSYRLEKMADIF